MSFPSGPCLSLSTLSTIPLDKRDGIMYNLSGEGARGREGTLVLTKLVFPPGMRGLHTILLLTDILGLLIRVGVPGQLVDGALVKGIRAPAGVQCISWHSFYVLSEKDESSRPNLS